MLAGSFLRDRHTLYRVLRLGHAPRLYLSQAAIDEQLDAGLLLSEAKNKTAFAISSAVPLGRACRFELTLLSRWLIDHESRHLIEEFP
jgi:hypothetical protein